MNLEIHYSKSNRSSGHCSVRMRSSGEKVLISAKQSMFSQCCTLTTASISKTAQVACDPVKSVMQLHVQQK